MNNITNTNTENWIDAYQQSKIDDLHFYDKLSFSTDGYEEGKLDRKFESVTYYSWEGEIKHGDEAMGKVTFFSNTFTAKNKAELSGNPYIFIHAIIDDAGVHIFKRKPYNRKAKKYEHVIDAFLDDKLKSLNNIGAVDFIQNYINN